MLGAIMTFLGVCALVALFMSIAHQFLRAAEVPEDVAREEQFRKLSDRGKPQPERRAPLNTHIDSSSKTLSQQRHELVSERHT